MNKNFKALKTAGAVILIALAVFNTTACKKQQTLRNIHEEKLFSINYGTFEDELQLFTLKNPGSINTKIAMKDGFFFIGDDSAKKIMQFTSFGDLTGIIYNPEKNPEPSFIRKMGNSDNKSDYIKNVTQAAGTYKFNSIEDIALDSHKNIFVIDQIAQERQELDKDSKLILREIVLKFTNDGKFEGFFGQEGLNGTPFSYIKDIFITNNDELVVVSMISNGYTVFWYNKNGTLRWKIPVNLDYIPEQDDEYFITIDKIVPDYTDSVLYIKADYYKVHVDQELNVQSGIDYKKTLLHPFNIETVKYDDAIEIPAYEDVIIDKFTKLIYKTPYEFLGVSDSKNFFFAIPDENGLVLQIMQGSNQRIIKRHIAYDMQNAVYTDFFLSKTGIITALIAKQNKADVIWWRTDSIMDKR